jgi:hypothetical protein
VDDVHDIKRVRGLVENQDDIGSLFVKMLKRLIDLINSMDRHAGKSRRLVQHGQEEQCFHFIRAEKKNANLDETPA